jgi:hypothetical protein
VLLGGKSGNETCDRVRRRLDDIDRDGMLLVGELAGIFSIH